MFNRLGAINKNQRGFTLLELMVAIGLAGIISSAITMTVFQMFTTNARSSAHMMAVKQVENAIHWVRQDVQMAQIVEPSGGTGFPLNLTWVDWNNTVNQVTYNLEDGQLERQHCVNGGEPSSMVVARHIDPDSVMTNCQFAGGVFILEITAAVGGFRPASESRVAEVVPRAAL